MYRTRRRVLIPAVAAIVLAASSPAGPSSAAADGDGAAASASPAAQLAVALDRALGDDSTLAMVRGYDRGYEAIQLTQGAFEGGLQADGVVVDERGAPLEPFRAPTSTLTASNTPQVEKGIARVTKRLDKLVDLAERVERLSIDDDALVALLTTALMVKGYSPEQIIVDGLMGQGLVLTGKSGLWTDVKIVDENGKTIKPDGVVESDDTTEVKAELDQFVDTILDTVAGLDPRSVADLEIEKPRDVRVTMRFTNPKGDASEVRAVGVLGAPRDGGVDPDRYLAGGATGTMDFSGSCGSEKFRASGPVNLGLAGPVTAGEAHVKVAFTSISLGGDLPKGCFGNLDLVEAVLLQATFPPVPVEVIRGKLQGGRYSAPVSLEGSSGSVEIAVE